MSMLLRLDAVVPLGTTRVQVAVSDPTQRWLVVCAFASLIPPIAYPVGAYAMAPVEVRKFAVRAAERCARSLAEST